MKTMHFVVARFAARAGVSGAMVSRFVAACVIGMMCFAATAVAAPDAGDDADLQALTWRLVGPFQGGRVPAVTGVPNDPLTYWFGGSDGGVWRTTDAGHHWRNVSDCCITTGAIGAIAIAPSAPKTIYVGTGEPFPRGDVATGNGMWKSTDDGATWQSIGLAQTRVISTIVVDPRDADHLYVGALGDPFIADEHRGVYESRDGGATWTRRLHVDDESGVVDLVADPADPRVMYAATWTVQRRPWLLTSGGKGSGIWKTTDGGATWQSLTRNDGLPAAPLGKIGLAISAANPRRLYALVQAKDGGLFRSEDAGTTWVRINDAAMLRQRAWYFTRIAADPTDADRIVVPQAHAMMISADGGKTFTDARAEGGDNHVVWIAPDDPRRMIVGNDQGATISRDGGASWSQNQNQPTAAFYHVNVDDEIPFNLYGAQQERATLRVASRNVAGWSIQREHWGTVAQWEAGFAVPVPSRSWITYSSGPYGLIQRADRRSGERQVFGPWPDATTARPAADLRERFQWVFPLVISHAAPDTIYVGSQRVWRTRDAGATWQPISDDLTRNDKSKQQATGGPIARDGTPVEIHGTVFALAQSPLDAALLWAGTDDGRVWITRDDGAHWRDVTPRAMPDFGTVSSIDASRLADGTAYVAARRERQGDYAPYLFATNDFGATWRRIDAGLPREDSSFVLRADTKQQGLLFAGTLRGVHVSFDDGAHWRSLKRNLPYSAVHDLQVVPQQDAIAVATHGRSFWVLDHVQPLREIAARDRAAPATLYTPQTVYLLGGYALEGSAEYGEGDNADAGAAIFYHVGNADAGDRTPLVLTIADASGATVATFSSEPRGQAKKAADAPIDPDAEIAADDATAAPEGDLSLKPGMQRYQWNLGTQMPAVARGDGPCAGPAVTPGRYVATLTRGPWRQSRAFEARVPPSSTATPDDLAARHALHTRIATLNCRLRVARADVAALRATLAEKHEQATARASRERIAQQQARLATIDATLFDHESDAYLDSVAHPVALAGRLGTVSWAAVGSLRRPGDTTVTLLDEIQAQIEAQFTALEALAREVDAPRAGSPTR